MYRGSRRGMVGKHTDIPCAFSIKASLISCSNFSSTLPDRHFLDLPNKASKDGFRIRSLRFRTIALAVEVDWIRVSVRFEIINELVNQY